MKSNFQINNISNSLPNMRHLDIFGIAIEDELYSGSIIGIQAEY